MKGKLSVKQNLEDDSVLARYLLGAASESERTLIEQHYFTEPDFYERLLAVEDDLIDAYVHRELSPEQTEQFENHFALSPQRRERISLAEALRMRASHAPQFAATSPKMRAAWWQSLAGFFLFKRPVVGFALASSLALALLAALWFVYTDGGEPRSSEVARVEQPRSEQPAQPAPQTSPSAEQSTTENRQSVPDATQQPRSPSKPTQSRRQNQSSSQAKSSSPVIATFALVPNLLRDETELKNLSVPQNAAQLRLQLSIETGGEYSSYQAELRRIGGAQIFRRAVGRPKRSSAGNTLVLTLPSKLFTDGDYILTLTGTNANQETEVIGDYPFTFNRK
jgi:hypothetical protein